MAPRDDLVPDSTFVFRTPLLPAGELVGWADGASDASDEACARLRERLRGLLDRPDVNEAVFLASPSLHESIAHWRDHPETPRGQRTERSLVRYLARMACRPTPFGLFSGVSCGAVASGADGGDAATRLAVVERARYGRSTRLDNDYLFALMTDLRGDPAMRSALRWRPNSSLYEQSGKLRYAEARLVGTLRTYHLVSVDASDYVVATLDRAQDGARPEELARALVEDDPEIALDEARAFVDEMIDAQLLVSELTPAITGPEPIVGILARLAEVAPESPALPRLREVSARLEALDHRPLGNAPAVYRELAATLEPLPTRVDLARLFQVDMVKPAPEAVLGADAVAEILRGVEVLRRITPAPDEDALATFRREFGARYEDREVPLCEALDEEAGVGFEVSNAPEAAGAPLLRNLAFPAAPGREQARWGPAQAHLLRLVQRAVATGAREPGEPGEIVLTEADVDRLSATRTQELPAAMSVMAQLAARSPEDLARGAFRVVMGACVGPSGARLLGRFCHALPAIHELVSGHLRAEEALRPDAAFAEIVHLNQGRIGNILCRPVLRDYEIPFLGVSGAPRDHQLPLQDLMVSVRGNRVVLRSRRLGREVVPRLSTAHNFRAHSIGVYRFLCTLQGQDGGMAIWSWGALETAPFLPRVCYRKLVLARARWLLLADDLAPLAKAVRAAKKASKPADLRARRAQVYAAARALRDSLGMPRFVVLADGDNELPIDFDNPLSVDSAAWLLAGRDRAVLAEFYPPPDELPACGPEGAFTHELLLTLTRRPSAGAGSVRQADTAVEAGDPGDPGDPAPGPRPRVTRSFAPGSEWLYAKLYTGTAGADEVLRRVVAPLRERALATGAARSWFFLRYSDPGHHVRVRFHGEPARLVGEVLPLLHELAAPLAADGTVWRIQLDTYEREIERYGGPAGIGPCERVFWHDSEAVLGIVELLEGDEGADARWRLALRGADQLLEDLGLDLDARFALMTTARDSFRNEFRADANFYKQIGARFRDERDALFAMLARDPARDEASDLAPGFALFAARSAALADATAELRARDRAGKLAPGVARFAWSHVHMHVNRLLHASQRAQELVLYDFLHRYYASRRARR